MPTYQYRCKDCDSDVEVVQKFTDDALTECPECDEGELRKVFNAVGVVFKGSGFYRTDSRGKGKGSASVPSTTPNPGSSETKGQATKEPAKAAASPAAASSD